jgi:hypothetical protein
MSFILIVNFDKNTIPEKLMSEIITNNPNLRKTDEHQYVFDFELLDFQHALIELTPFPPDEAHIKLYLQFTHVILKDLNSLSEYSEKFCLADHKRMTMEPLGVSFSSLFMVKSFGIKWQHIAHLPQEFYISVLRQFFLSVKCGYYLNRFFSFACLKFSLLCPRPISGFCRKFSKT